MTTQQNQIDALEQLLLAVIRASRPALSQGAVIAMAKRAVLSDERPVGAEDKANAVQYLEQLYTQLKQN